MLLLFHNAILLLNFWGLFIFKTNNLTLKIVPSDATIQFWTSRNLVDFPVQYENYCKKCPDKLYNSYASIPHHCAKSMKISIITKVPLWTVLHWKTYVCWNKITGQNLTDKKRFSQDQKVPIVWTPNLAPRLNHYLQRISIPNLINFFFVCVLNKIWLLQNSQQPGHKAEWQD